MPKRKGAAASAAKKKKFGSDAESSGDEWGSAAKVSAYLHASTGKLPECTASHSHVV